MMRRNGVIRSFLAAMLIAICIAGIPGLCARAAGADTAYKKILSSGSVTSYAKVDVNHDGVKELFVRKSGSQVLYTYHKGKAKKVKEFATGDMIQVSKKACYAKTRQIKMEVI